ncbi:hypothetical protein B0H14DRAFT_3621722 [Mycena olivaceomarginata]|nr:hypothetical protein B0H14DRAFT_3621722 [Mycena olivaceomarginata]
MPDEIATEKWARYDNRTNKVVGICRQHGGKLPLDLRTGDDLNVLCKEVKDGNGHLAGETCLNVFAAPSGRYFSTSAITLSLELNASHTEDLTELDSGPPTDVTATTESCTTINWVPSSERPPATDRKSYDKLRSKQKRDAQRAAAKLKADAPLDARAHHPRHLLKAGSPIKAPFQFSKVGVAATGWVGIRDSGICDDEGEAGQVEHRPSPTHTLHDFFGPHASMEGFTNVPYLGPCVFIPSILSKYRHPFICIAQSNSITNANEKVWAVYGGMPIEQAHKDASFSYERYFQRRGNFSQLSFGASMGGGQVEPGELVNGIINAAILASLLSNSAFIRLAGFATGVFANWAPSLYDMYVEYMSVFYKKYPKLRRPFLNGVFSACTFNLGPQTCALGHQDFQNLAFGWCASTALGKFDYKRGGYLILWDAKLILEFPPGCTILIPFAAIYHSNIPIGRNETRYSHPNETSATIRNLGPPGPSLGAARLIFNEESEQISHARFWLGPELHNFRKRLLN